MAALLSENFTVQQFNTDFNINDILTVHTLTKPLTFAEINLITNSLKRWQMFVASRRLLKQCFNKWKEYHHKMATESQNESTAQKIDVLISELHRMKTKRKKIVRCNSNAVDAKKQKGNVVAEKAKSMVGSECFKNRFKTQKDIIVIQKAKLEEQSRMIEDLKLGIIKDELSKSLEHTKVELKQIFGKSSSKLASSAIKIEDTLATFIVNSSKAPKFIQKMERRALERAKNREIIRERKRLIDEEKQRIFEEVVEQKRMQDEEEKHRNLEAIKEKQRAELERQKIIQANKEKYFADLKRAIWFHKRKILRRCFHGLQHNVYIVRNSVLRAEGLYEKSLKQHAFRCWKKYLVVKYKKENDKADEFFKKHALSNSFECWKSHHRQCVQNFQVAQDFCDLKLLTNVFISWHRYVCVQYVLEQKNLRKAEFHYKNRILVQYFYLWKSLPAIIQLERAKEEKKRKWREKVKEIIPDYSPLKDD